MAIKHLLEVSYLQITTSLEGLQTPISAIFILSSWARLICLYTYVAPGGSGNTRPLTLQKKMKHHMPKIRSTKAGYKVGTTAYVLVTISVFLRRDSFHAALSF